MKATIYSDDFNRIISATKRFVSRAGSNTKIHQYIRLEFDHINKKVTAIAVDGFRMSVEHAALCECDEDFVVYFTSSTHLPKGQYADIELHNGEALIRCNGLIVGCVQPVDGKFVNYKEVLPEEEVVYKIGFNGNYLLDALQSAKESLGGGFKNPVVLELRNPNRPIILRTNKDDVKLVCPVRIKD